MHKLVYMYICLLLPFDLTKPCPHPATGIHDQSFVHMLLDVLPVINGMAMAVPTILHMPALTVALSFGLVTY